MLKTIFILLFGFQPQAPEVYHVRLTTTKGNIDLEVRREWSPHGADRFYQLVRQGYYDSAAVFRIRAATWAQFAAIFPTLIISCRPVSLTRDNNFSQKRGFFLPKPNLLKVNL